MEKEIKIIEDKWEPSVFLIDWERDGFTLLIDGAKKSFCFSLTDLREKINQHPNLGPDGEKPILSMQMLPVHTKVLDRSPLPEQMHHNLNTMQKELDDWQNAKKMEGQNENV